MTHPDRYSPEPAEITVRCAGARHTLRWEAGTLTAIDHPDADRERALVALGADRYRCLDLLQQWEAHADDLDVLVLAGRGPGDDLPVNPDDNDDDDATPSRTGHHHKSGSVVYHGRYRPLGRPGTQWLMHSGGPEPVDHGAGSLLTLDRRLADRLVATVLQTWTARVARNATEVGPARAALRAAVYGRASRTVRSWLGDPSRPVDVQLLGAGEQPFARQDGTGGVLLGLGFDWLVNVWQPGAAVTMGRLCLQAERTGPSSWSLLSVGPELGEPRTMRVTW